MVAGHLQEKNDFYYIVLSYKDAAGKRKTKWEATGLSVKRQEESRGSFAGTSAELHGFHRTCGDPLRR